jgi:hypothetical protein
MALLSICVVALLIGALRLATQRAPLPTGSSYSAQPDGAMALYAWAEAVGGRSRRLQDLVLDDSPTTLVVLQPETPIDSTARDAFDAVARRGGTLVLAGDSLPWLLYARSLGVTVEPIAASASSASTPDGLSVAFVARYRVRAATSQPLLVRADGDVLGLQMAYKQGSLVVVASPEPLTNAALGQDQTARFVYREIVSSSASRTLAFDEVHHSFAPPAAGGPMTINQLLFDTPPGRAVIYAALLTFVYLALSGRRLGPPLPGVPATETRRTMYEHVQMLASLYRRAGQFPIARAAFSRHYSRRLARSAATPGLAESLARVERARTESELIAAVAALDDAS